MEIPFKEWVERLVAYPELNSKFVNTLSFLEYVGARKILKSQNAGSITVELLSHIAEEIRHAHVLKKLALKMSGGKLISYSDGHLLCAKEARSYVQAVDRAAVEEFGTHNPWINYLYTTFLLEERAKAIYPFYDAALEKKPYPRVFKGILKEEENHLHAIFQEFGSLPEITEDKLNKLRKIEDQAFSLFMNSLAKELESREVDPSHDSSDTHHISYTERSVEQSLDQSTF